MPPVPAWRRTPRHRPRPKGQSTKRRRRPITPKRDGAAARPSRPTGRRRRTGRSTSPKGSQLILATNMATTPSDQPTFAATILAIEHTIGLPQTVLADAGFASGAAVAKLEAKKVEPLVALAKTQPHRPYDFRPPPKPKPERRIREPWRLAMKIKLQSEEGKARYKKRKQTVEPVFDIIKSAIGFTRFHLRSRESVATEWLVVALAYNCRRLCRLRTA